MAEENMKPKSNKKPSSTHYLVFHGCLGIVALCVIAVTVFINLPVCNPLCKNGGKCELGNLCSCPLSKGGPDCSDDTCDKPCQNGGVCTAGNKCICPRYFRGRLCDEPVCSPSCVNGECTIGNVCNCTENWTGELCNIRKCASQCDHGTCIRTGNIEDAGDGESCECDPFWTGSQCDSRHCDPGCGDHGTCINGNRCKCNAGFAGDDCTKADFSSGEVRMTCWETYAGIERTDSSNGFVLSASAFPKDCGVWIRVPGGIRVKYQLLSTSANTKILVFKDADNVVGGAGRTGIISSGRQYKIPVESEEHYLYVYATRELVAGATGNLIRIYASRRSMA